MSSVKNPTSRKPSRKSSGTTPRQQSTKSGAPLLRSKVEGWTDARWKSFIVSALRSGFSRYPNKYAALRNAYTTTKLNKKSGKQAKHYRCAMCKKEFTSTNVQVDHTTPVVGSEGFVDWNTYVDRMYCDVVELQVLCRECHSNKTSIERKARSAAKAGSS